MWFLDWPTFLAFITACFFLAIVPGPTVTLIVANALARGPMAGLMTVLGAQIAILLMVIVVALGLQAVIGFMSWAFFWVKLAGAAYLFWIGYKMITNRGGLSFDEKSRVINFRQSVSQGFWVTMSNPKALLFSRCVFAPIHRRECTCCTAGDFAGFVHYGSIHVLRWHLCIGGR